MIRPSLFGTLIIIVVYLPILTLTGVEGKMFHADGADRADGARRRGAVLSLTFVPAAVAHRSSTGKVSREGELVMRGAQRLYVPLLDCGDRAIAPWSSRLAPSLFVAVRLAARRAWAASSSRASTRAISRCTRMRIPGTSLTQSVDMQIKLGKAHRASSRGRRGVLARSAPPRSRPTRCRRTSPTASSC